jgi:plastocyanin
MRAVTMIMTLAVLAGCGGGNSPTTPGGGGGNPPPGGGGGGGGSTSNLISIQDNSFSPASTTLSTGATVTWTNEGNSSHNVTFDNVNVGNSPSSMANGATFQRTFANAGTYHYHCTIHGAGMAGTVIIQ